MTTETTLEQQCVKFADNLGIPSFRLDINVDVDFPQRIFLIPGGRPLFVLFNQSNDDDKLKEKQEKQEKQEQQLELDYLKENNYNVIAVDNFKCFLEGLKLSFKAHLKREKNRP